VAALASGLVTGTSEARGGASHVSPWDVGLAAAVGGGKGLFAGMVAGKVLGALAGLTPDAQQTLMRTGTWAGMLSGAIQTAF